MKLLLNKKYLLFIFAAIIILNYAWFVFIDRSIESYFFTISSASILYLVCALILYKVEVELKYIFWITTFIFLFKIFSMEILPVGSDDYYRYLWDGKVLVNGINPFQFPPNSESLSHLHSELLPKEVTYPDIKTIYFPLSQAVFAFVYLIGGESIWGLKVIMILSDILLTFGFFFLLKKNQINNKYVLLYVLSPLVFYQFFIDAHIDILGMALFLYSIYFFKEQKIFAALFLGASLIVKPTFMIAIPIFFFYEKEMKDKLKWFVIPIILLAVSFIPFSFTANPFETLINYSRHWSFNGAAFNLLAVFLNDTFVIRFILLILFILIYLVLLRYNKDVFSSLFYSLMFFLLCSPVVHPWYAAWLIVLLVVNPKLSGISYISLISITFYTVMIYQLENVWEENTIILLIEYIPVIILLLYEFWFILNKKDSRNSFIAIPRISEGFDEK